MYILYNSGLSRTISTRIESSILVVKGLKLVSLVTWYKKKLTKGDTICGIQLSVVLYELNFQMTMAIHIIYYCIL